MRIRNRNAALYGLVRSLLGEQVHELNREAPDVMPALHPGSIVSKEKRDTALDIALIYIERAR